MKFLCDRCKTRYSIADERVRGKILKIRCKNCSNVITVREGMPEPEPEPAPAAGGRVPRATDYAPAVISGSGNTTPPPATPAATAGRPLQAAFAQAMAKPAAPPPALEEEWYVSIDGNQEGPFPLSEAQAWVRRRRPEEEIFCWCEGFDDWLPVEKVSHFRGLRAKKPAPAPRTAPARAVPPPPGSRTGAVPTIPSSQLGSREEEPKPLFAATLAALEADAARPGEDGVDERATTTPEPVPSGRRARRPTAGESAVAELRDAPGAVASGPTSAPTRGLPPRPFGNSPPAKPEPVLARATPSTGTPARPGKATGSPVAFDDSDSDDVAPAPSARSAPISLDALAGLRPGGDAPAPVNGHGAKSAPPGPSDSAPDLSSDLQDDDDEGDAGGDDLAIGEVSRVVRLQDLAAAAAKKAASKKPVAPAASARATAAVQALTEATAPASALAEAAASSLVDDGHAAPVASVAGEPAAVLAPVAAPPRKGHVPLIAVGSALLLAVIGLVIFFASSSGSGDEGRTIGGAGGDVEDLAISPDDPRYVGPRGGSGVGIDPGTGKVTRPRNPRGSGSSGSSGGDTGPVANGNGQTGNNPNGKQESVLGPDGQPLEPLTPEDVIMQAQKSSTGYQRCYQRALKADPFLKVKSINALITISKDGKVTNVGLDQMQNDPLGQCLTAAIQRWPFRKSTAGIVTKITLKFEQGGF